MFSGLSREDFSGSRFRKALPVFLLLWFGGSLLATVYLLTVRTQLQTIEHKAVETLLADYLSTKKSANIYFDPTHLKYRSPLQGLTFVRIMKGDDHVILVAERAEHPTFKGLVNLRPERQGIWLTVGSGKEQRVLSIITKKYADGLLIQAGKDGEQGYEFFQKLVRRTLWLIFGSILAVWPLALYYIKLSLSPLVDTRKKIAELTRHPKSGLLDESGNGPELDSLYRQINLLISQNRHLVTEMQNSLDNVAHDLRTPMTRLRSVAEYGLQAEDDTARLRESLSDCLEESDRVLAMLKIMMSVAEAESGTMRLRLQKCEIGVTLAEVITLYEYVAEEKGVVVEVEGEWAIWLILDHVRISQVWANLLDNAIKYSRDGGWVKISIKSTGSHGVIVFSDNGMGISENEQDRIWERLYRGDRSRSQPGIGLGLSYVKAVVEAHGGEVSVTSVLHEGSRFEVRLPLAQLTTQEKSHINGE